MNMDKPGSARNAKRRKETARYKKRLHSLLNCGFNVGVREKTSAAGKNYCVRIFRPQRLSSFYKKRTARAQRRVCDLPDGNAYRKTYEYWWNIN